MTPMLVTDSEIWGRGNSVHVAGLQRGQKQPEARNGHREWVQVNTGHCVQRPLRDVPDDCGSWLVADHSSTKRWKPPSRKCPEPQVGSIIRTAIAELPNSWGQRPVENEFPTNSGVQPTRSVCGVDSAQALVEVAEEACVFHVGSVKSRISTLGIGGDLLPKLHHRHRSITADAQAKNRVVRFVEEGCEGPARYPGLLETPMR